MMNFKKSFIRFSRSGPGFTLIETVVVISMTALIFAAVSWAIVSFYRANAYVIQQSFAVNNARKGVEKMVKEIREATYSDVGSYPIVSASSSEFIFYSDVDRDNKVERIRYTINGINLERGETKSSGDPLAYDLENEKVSPVSGYIRNTTQQPVFSYFDSLGNKVANLNNVSEISLVKIKLVVNIVEGRAPEEFTLYSTAQMRNLKTNL